MQKPKLDSKNQCPVSEIHVLLEWQVESTKNEANRNLNSKNQCPASEIHVLLEWQVESTENEAILFVCEVERRFACRQSKRVF